MAQFLSTKTVLRKTLKKKKKKKKLKLYEKRLRKETPAKILIFGNSRLQTSTIKVFLKTYHQSTQKNMPSGISF